MATSDREVHEAEIRAAQAEAWVECAETVYYVLGLVDYWEYQDILKDNPYMPRLR